MMPPKSLKNDSITDIQPKIKLPNTESREPKIIGSGDVMQKIQFHHRQLSNLSSKD
jgi:hypothetical protein